MGVAVRLWSSKLRLGTLLVSVALGTTAVCGAASSTASTPDYSKAEDTFAGSQIAAVEGTGDPPRFAADAGALGHDVSGHQGEVNWPGAWGAGGRFVYVKATEGTGFINKQFAQQYNGSYQAGMVRGAYHFARPDVSGGRAQAEYFLAHGGGWSADGRTLPGALDAEYNPYGDACYGLDPARMVAWLREFSDTYHARTGRFPVIYTSTNWWNRCTGNNAEFAQSNPLWIARYQPTIGPLPAGWTRQFIWQFADSGALPGDQNLFNGALDQVKGFAANN
ncbi:lysozyme [Amycolatopsis granulosa]|uniref:lysozyme n=1 Tax=Amycolatopsis granulosa TaxID=185684 RepID=UPI00141E0BBC|nr:lysozyme [Amycolatopsis granulosa]NIH86456.1 GH25 family lysozyme M1 (1,4-beta-N-acetylmuramidase) [Amycolatopsis granulosa]